MINQRDVILCCLFSSLLTSVQASRVIAPPEDYQSKAEHQVFEEDQYADVTTNDYDVNDDITETQNEYYPPVDRNENTLEKIPKQRCGYPDSMANSNHNVTQHWVLSGTVAEYRCDPGFYLLGDNLRVCQPSFRWSGKAPQCGAKVSLGKSIVCTATRNVDFEALVDNKENTCSLFQPTRNPNNTDEHWSLKMDLLGEYKSITSFRLLFVAGKFQSLPIDKIQIGNGYGSWNDITYTECTTVQREVGRNNLRELIITPNRLHSGRYVNFNFKFSNFGESFHFCEIDVFDTNTPSIYQCFDKNKLDDSKASQTILSNTVLSGKYCYTFVNQHINWNTASSMCSKVNDGVLVNDLNPDLTNFLLSFSKSKLFNSFYWTGGKAESKFVPGKSQQNSLVWMWNNGKRFDHPMIPGDEKNCLGIDVSSKQWAQNPCTYGAKLICQTGTNYCTGCPRSRKKLGSTFSGTPAIKQCSSPHLQPKVLAIAPFTLEIGSHLSLRCPEGIHRVGDEQRECLANGHWSGQSPQCLGEADHAAYQAHQSQLPDEAILGIIIAAIIVGLILITVIAAVIVSKSRGGRFKKKIYFNNKNKKEGCESVETLEDPKEDTQKLNKDKKENYESVNQSCENETQQQTQEAQTSS